MQRSHHDVTDGESRWPLGDRISRVSCVPALTTEPLEVVGPAGAPAGGGHHVARAVSPIALALRPHQQAVFDTARCHSLSSRCVLDARSSTTSSPPPHSRRCM